jgi:hypothetical protein
MYLWRIGSWCLDPDATGGTTGDKPDETAALKARLAEVEGKLAEAARAEEARLAEAAKAKADAEAADAAKRGEWEKLHATEKAAREAAEAKLTDLSAREEKRVKAVEERNKARLKDVPDTHKTLIPKGLAPDDLEDYLTTNAAMLFGEVRPAGGVRGTRPVDTAGIPDEIVAESARYGKEPAVWWAIVKRSDPKRAARLTSNGAN